MATVIVRYKSRRGKLAEKAIIDRSEAQKEASILCRYFREKENIPFSSFTFISAI